MKILHTADWHIGKRLYQKDLAEDHQLFFDWLIDMIQRTSIDVLLVSGDIFDLANPSAEARKLYYSVLSRLARTKVQVVLTGGNHDSPAMLNAPKELLDALNIQVVGNLPEDLAQMVIPLGASKGNPELVVAAIPYIRDNDLRRLAPGQSYEERTEAIREGIQAIFAEAAQLIGYKYPNALALAMGHLFAHGASTSDSERDIQVGNLAGVEASSFPSAFAYIALGHIHKPQKAGAEHIRYAGSPIPLSFSERVDTKQVLVITASAKGVEQLTAVELPVWRELRRLSGSLEELRLRLAQIEKGGQLPTLCEVVLETPRRDPVEMQQFEALVGDFNRESGVVEIVKTYVKLTGKEISATELFANKQVEELSPGEVFGEWLKAHDLAEEKTKLMTEAFDELLQEYYQQVGE